MLSDADTSATAMSFGGLGRVIGTATVQQYITPNPGAANAANLVSGRPFPNGFGLDETRGGAAPPFSGGYWPASGRI